MDSAGGQELSEETKAERLMRLRLPEYIVNCLLVAGFDTLDVIAKMNVGQEPGNSIEMVENFVTANFSGDERYMYAPLGQQIVCKFPPGHRLRIEQFIRELRATQSSNEHVVLHVATNSATKKRKVCAKPAQPKEGSSSYSHEDISTKVGIIRQQIAKWQHTTSDQHVRKLQEHEHFEIIFKHGFYSIHCKVCSQDVKLSSKNQKVILSNWTHHICQCIKRSEQHQPVESIDHHFSSCSSSSTVNINKPCISNPISKSCNIQPFSSSNAIITSVTSMCSSNLQDSHLPNASTVQSILPSDMSLPQPTLKHDALKTSDMITKPAGQVFYHSPHVYQE